MKNLLFLSLIDINSINDENIYTDLLREFIKNNYSVFIVSPNERRKKESTKVINENNCKILKVKIGNITKTNILEKGISTLLIESQFKSAIRKNFKNIKFDLVLYATPPITFCNVIKYIKKRDNAKSYLMLKDIFPQNAVDLGMVNSNGIIYKYFRHKEKMLYKISDKIGCMSEANVDYLLSHNDFIDSNKVEVCPNSIEVKDIDLKINKKENTKFRSKYNIPKDAKIFIYGGNLGKPQGVDFIIKCLKANENKDDRFFIICGNGTEYYKIKNYINNDNPNNILLINGLPKHEYEELLRNSDVGLIFLDYRFTIPNFPSRLLSYLQYGKPVLSCTDNNTDIGDIGENNHFGWKCYSNDLELFNNVIDTIIDVDSKKFVSYGKNAYKYLDSNYNVNIVFKKILDIL